MHAGHIGLAPDSSAFKVAEGTSRLPQGLLHLSGAVVRLHSKVTHISRDGSSWKVRVAGGEHSERFDMVVVAAPVSRANITFSGVKLEGSMMRARDESVADIQGKLAMSWCCMFVVSDTVSAFTTRERGKYTVKCTRGWLQVTTSRCSKKTEKKWRE